MEPDNDNRTVEYWLDQAEWPAPDVRLRARIMDALDAQEDADIALPPAFMIAGRGSFAFGARGLLMMAVVIGLSAGAVAAGTLDSGSATGNQSVSEQGPVYAGSGLTLAGLYNGDE